MYKKARKPIGCFVQVSTEKNRYIFYVSSFISRKNASPASLILPGLQ